MRKVLIFFLLHKCWRKLFLFPVINLGEEVVWLAFTPAVTERDGLEGVEGK